MPLAYVSVENEWGSHIGLNPLTTLWACCVIGESVTFILMMGAIGAPFTYTSSPAPAVGRAKPLTPPSERVVVAVRVCSVFGLG